MRGIEPWQHGSSIRSRVADLGKPEAVIVGSALYQVGWLPEATTFVQENAAALSRIPTCLFSVGPLATDMKDDEEQPIELATFRDKIGESLGRWHHSIRSEDRLRLAGASWRESSPERVGHAERVSAG